MKFLVMDCETTGLVKHPDAKDGVQPRVIEFGAVIVEDGEVVESYHTLINPKEPLEPVITKITGLTDEDLADARTFPEVVDELLPLFKRCDGMVAHNLPFDHRQIEMELERLGIADDWPWPPLAICTVQEFAEEWGRRPKMLELYEETFGKPLEQTHRALDDVEALVDICLAKGLFETYEHSATQSEN